jgi:hypothetical protein
MRSDDCGAYLGAQSDSPKVPPAGAAASAICSVSLRGRQYACAAGNSPKGGAPSNSITWEVGTTPISDDLFRPLGTGN